jgi:LysM repeat protein
VLALCLALGAQAAEPSLAYTVQPGDKLIVLSREMLVRPDAWAEIARLNALPDPDVIRPGQTLNIPLRLLKYAPVSGRVVSVQGSVQQGSATAVVGGTVGEGARLQTGADSSAVIEMSDGSRVQLLPASLAEVIASREYVLRDANASGTTQLVFRDHPPEPGGRGDPREQARPARDAAADPDAHHHRRCAGHPFPCRTGKRGQSERSR